MNNSRKVLLVEDNFIAQVGAKFQLESMGYEVDIAETGKKAIELATTNVYLAIFMDIGLPDITGFVATKEIKKKFPDAFILALTAHEEDEEKAKAAKEANLDGYIRKPLTEKLIKQYLDKLI